MHQLLPALQQGLADLGLALTDEQQSQLLAYVDLIGKWTQVYNLTAVRDAHEMLTHHLLDSLAVIAPLRRELAKLPVPTREPLVAGADLVLGHVVTACADPVGNALHCQVLGNEHSVNDDGVAGGLCGAHEFELGRVGEDCLGDERPARLDQGGPSVGGDAGRRIGVRRGVVGPALTGYFVGVDEHAAGQQWRQGERHEGGFTGTIGPDDEVEAFHAGAIGAVSGPWAGVRRCRRAGTRRVGRRR